MDNLGEGDLFLFHSIQFREKVLSVKASEKAAGIEQRRGNYEKLEKIYQEKI